MSWFSLVLLGAFAISACGAPPDEIVYVERSSCLGCHRPLQDDGAPAGIEHAHPPVEGRHLSCTGCHGGDPTARAQSSAHVAQPPGADDLDALTHLELDAVDPEYLRFANPGDLRVADRSCGDEGCHPSVVAAVRASASATMAGELAAPRWRAGRQDGPAPAVGLYEAEGLRAFAEPIVTQDERRVGPFLELYMSKRCLGCHLWSAGQGPSSGAPRSTGCSACHVSYAADGLSRSADPMIDKGRRPRPETHAMVASPPTRTCEGCPRGGARIGLSYQGLSPDGVPGAETPPDVHHEAGMTCADCHSAAEVHGAGGAPPTCAGCHDDRSPANHGPDHDRLACDTCHSGWIPSCYGCHVEVDMVGLGRSQVDGRLTNGRITEVPGPVDTDSLVMMLDGEGRVSLSMPGQRLFLSALDGEGARVLDRQVRTGRDGRPGMGQRPAHPHTVRRVSAMASCDRCHPTAAFDNEAQVYEAVGIGTGRRTDTDGAGVVWDLAETRDARTGADRVMAVEGGPLPEDMVRRILSVTAP